MFESVVTIPNYMQFVDIKRFSGRKRRAIWRDSPIPLQSISMRRNALRLLRPTRAVADYT
jgi:hypothetical protein